MAQIHTTQLETQRNSSAHPDQIEGSVHETASTAIKAAALSFGADVVGIANIERWEAYAPAGYRPTDLLPGARSVVVVGARGPTAGAWRAADPRLMEVLGLDFANDRAIAALTGFIEQEYEHYAIQAPGLSVACLLYTSPSPRDA